MNFWVRSCLEKKSYPTKALANQVAIKVYNERKTPLRSYHCDLCTKWHLTKQVRQEDLILLNQKENTQFNHAAYNHLTAMIKRVTKMCKNHREGIFLNKDNRKRLDELNDKLFELMEKLQL